MFTLSRKSKERLSTCHPDLQRVVNILITIADVTVLCGHRGQAEQDEAYKNGKSDLQWPKGKHNSIPSMAVDIAPFPLDWSDTFRFTYIAGMVVGIGAALGLNIRWGGDWDSDEDLKDNISDDLPHFELAGKL